MSAARMFRNIAGTPSTSPSTSTSAKPSMTVATSRSLTIVPSMFAISTTSRKSSPTMRFWSVRRISPPASVRSSPEDTLSEDSRIARASSEMVRLLRRSCSSLTTIEISRSAAPKRETIESDGSASRSSCTRSAAARSSVLPSAVEVTATVMMIRCALVNTISGCSALSGGNPSMRSTADMTSSRTVTGSANGSSWTVTVPSPSVAVDVTRLTPSTAIRFSSSRRLTLSSTSAGELPGNGTVMEI